MPFSLLLEHLRKQSPRPSIRCTHHGPHFAPHPTPKHRPPTSGTCCGCSGSSSSCSWSLAPRSWPLSRPCITPSPRSASPYASASSFGGRGSCAARSAWPWCTPSWGAGERGGRTPPSSPPPLSWSSSASWGLGRPPSPCWPSSCEVGARAMCRGKGEGRVQHHVVVARVVGALRMQVSSWGTCAPLAVLAPAHLPVALPRSRPCGATQQPHDRRPGNRVGGSSRAKGRQTVRRVLRPPARGVPR